MQFKYCDCCKCVVANIGYQSYTVYDDLKSTYTLYRGHGTRGRVIGVFFSWELVEQRAKKVSSEDYHRIKRNPRFNRLVPPGFIPYDARARSI